MTTSEDLVLDGLKQKRDPLPPSTPIQYATVWARAAARLAWQYGALTRPSRAQAARFGEVERFVLFVGYPRSGHSLVGALLDAHPEAVLGHEVGAVQLVHARFDRDRLYAALLASSVRYADAACKAYDYGYAVPGQHQGRARRLRVIGDKHGEGAGLRLGERPHLLDRLRRTVGVPLRVIHGVRNPFDNVATIALRAAEVTGGPVDLGEAVRRYGTLWETAARLRRSVAPDEWADHRHEDLVADPEAALRRLCGFAGLDAPDGYVAACAGIVHASPHQSRHKVTWTDAARGAVEDLIGRYDALIGYSFDT